MTGMALVVLVRTSTVRRRSTKLATALPLATKAHRAPVLLAVSFLTAKPFLGWVKWIFTHQRQCFHSHSLTRLPNLVGATSTATTAKVIVAVAAAEATVTRATDIVAVAAAEAMVTRATDIVAVVIAEAMVNLPLVAGVQVIITIGSTMTRSTKRRAESISIATDLKKQRLTM